MDRPRKVPIEVRVKDKRRTATGQEEARAAAPAGAGAESPARPAEPSATGTDPTALSPDPAAEAAGGAPEERVYLDDLRRLQAEFENYRKRMMKEQAHIGARAAARVVERLLPVLDNLERALAHGEGGPGVELVYKELKEVLSGEGFEEIDAQGKPFDPTFHEAFQVVEDRSAREPVVHEVFRRGYRHGDRVIRPAMVVVARPPEGDLETAGESEAAEA